MAVGIKFGMPQAANRQSSAPLVSILIPAYRPTWLNEAISSALAQTFRDFELLISDDSADGEVERLVGEWTDPRIQYFRNPNRGMPGSNRDHLISRARGEYIKFLFDDDILYPQSLEMLLAVMRWTGSKLSFHSRDIIDDRGRLLESLPFFVGPAPRNSFESFVYRFRNELSLPRAFRRPFLGTTDFAIVEPRYFYEEVIGKVMNSIGEPSNVLLHTQTLRSLDRPFQVGDHRFRFLTDMALYANFFDAGAVVAGTSWVGSAFRKHGMQTSNRQYPGYSAGLFEWDLLGRWAFDLGRLSYAGLRTQHMILDPMYEAEVDNYPELRHLLNLGIGLDDAPLFGQRFDKAQQFAYQAIDERRARLTGGVC